MDGRWGVYILTLAWGFQRCSFRHTGQCESLYCVERVTALLHAFLVYANVIITMYINGQQGRVGIIKQKVIMKLRKVTFQLCRGEGIYPDMSPDEERQFEESTRTRNGYFHCWTPAIVHNAQLDQDVPGTLAIIEEAGSGKLYELGIYRFKFVYPPEYVDL